MNSVVSVSSVGHEVLHVHSFDSPDMIRPHWTATACAALVCFALVTGVAAERDLKLIEAVKAGQS